MLLRFISLQYHQLPSSTFVHQRKHQRFQTQSSTTVRLRSVTRSMIQPLLIESDQWHLFFSNQEHDLENQSTNIDYNVHTPTVQNVAFSLDRDDEGYTSSYFSLVQKPYADDPRSFLYYKAHSTTTNFQKIMSATTEDGLIFTRAKEPILFQQKELPADGNENFFALKDSNPCSRIQIRGVAGIDTIVMRREKFATSHGIQAYASTILNVDANFDQNNLNDDDCFGLPTLKQQMEKQRNKTFLVGSLHEPWFWTDTIWGFDDHPDNKVEWSVFDGQTTVAWDSIRRQYILWARTNTGPGLRKTHYSTSKDFHQWTRLQPSLYPNQNMSCYLLNAVDLPMTPYMLAFPQCYIDRPDHTNTMNMFISLFFSIDGGVTWRFLKETQNYLPQLRNTAPHRTTNYNRQGKGTIVTGMYDNELEHYLYYHSSPSIKNGKSLVERLSIRKHGFVGVTAKKDKDTKEGVGVLVFGPIQTLKDMHHLYLNVLIPMNGWVVVKMYDGAASQQHTHNGEDAVLLVSQVVEGPINDVEYEVNFLFNTDENVILSSTSTQNSLRTTSSRYVVKIQISQETEVFGIKFVT